MHNVVIKCGWIFLKWDLHKRKVVDLGNAEVLLECGDLNSTDLYFSLIESGKDKTGISLLFWLIQLQLSYSYDREKSKKGLSRIIKIQPKPW